MDKVGLLCILANHIMGSIVLSLLCTLQISNDLSQIGFTQISRFPALKAPFDDLTQKLLGATRT